MNCPACKLPMVVLELDKIEIDYCLSCRGIWLDAGELELLLDDSRGGETLLTSLRIDKNNKEKTRKCPICSKTMQKILCGTNEKIIIDKCSFNDGIWFDANELDTIIKMASFDKDNKVLDLLKDMFGKT